VAGFLQAPLAVFAESVPLITTLNAEHAKTAETNVERITSEARKAESSGVEWCGREDSNLHWIAPTSS
jgi:hypothetical protein